MRSFSLFQELISLVSFGILIAQFSIWAMVLLVLAGLPAFVNCIGIESPGLTAAPAIAARVCDLLAGL